MNRNVLVVAQRFRRYATVLTVAFIPMLLFTQCAKRPSMTTGVVDRVALMGTLVSFKLPSGINVPVGISRSQFKNMSAEINQLMANYVDTLHHAVASNLRTQLGCEVIYGKELQSLPVYGEVRESYERADALISVDDHFPQVYISSGDFNFIMTESDATGIVGMKFLKPDEAKQTVANLCEDLNIKYLAYAHFAISGYKLNLVTPNTAVIWYGLNLYNQDGDMIASSVAMQEGTIKEGQPEVVQMLLDQYLGRAEQLEITVSKIKK